MKVWSFMVNEYGWFTLAILGNCCWKGKPIDGVDKTFLILKEKNIIKNKRMFGGKLIRKIFGRARP